MTTSCRQRVRCTLKLEEVKAWQGRPLEELYPILYLDALVIKVRDGHTRGFRGRMPEHPADPEHGRPERH